MNHGWTRGSKNGSNILVLCDAPVVETHVIFNKKFTVAWSSGTMEICALHVEWMDQDNHPIVPAMMVWLTDRKVDLETIVVYRVRMVIGVRARHDRNYVESWGRLIPVLDSTGIRVMKEK